MTTTPKQLQAWRVAARFAYGCDNTVTISSDPYSAYIAGYLRAKQETEQEIKDAVKDTVKTMASAFIVTLDENKVPIAQEVRVQLMELLK